MNENNKPGVFIAFEGIDGSGKSTQIKLLAKKLASLGIKCFETKEPTDLPVGALIRKILTGKASADNRVTAALFTADRLDHLLNEKEGILKLLNNGTSVLTDRYYFSSYAYQSVDADMDWIIDCNRLSSQILKPAVTVFLDIPVKTALERVDSRGEARELFEKEERLTQVREKYFEAFEKLADTENIVIIDADCGAAEAAERVWNAVADIFIRRESQV